MRFETIFLNFINLFKLNNNNLQKNLTKHINYLFIFIIAFFDIITTINSKTFVHYGVRQRNSSLPLWQYIDQQLGARPLNMSLILNPSTTMRRRRKWKHQRKNLTNATIINADNATLKPNIYKKLNKCNSLSIDCENLTNLYVYFF